MEIELHPNRHAQKGKRRHEHIARNLFHPGDAGSEEISHDDIDGNNDHLKRQENAGQKSADEVDDIENLYNFHETRVSSFATFIIQNTPIVKLFYTGLSPYAGVQCFLTPLNKSDRLLPDPVNSFDSPSVIAAKAYKFRRRAIHSR
jgi:hypothetical protein